MFSSIRNGLVSEILLHESDAVKETNGFPQLSGVKLLSGAVFMNSLSLNLSSPRPLPAPALLPSSLGRRKNVVLQGNELAGTSGQHKLHTVYKVSSETSERKSRLLAERLKQDRRSGYCTWKSGRVGSTQTSNEAHCRRVPPWQHGRSIGRFSRCDPTP